MLSPTVEFFFVLLGYFNVPICGECVHRVCDLTELFDGNFFVGRVTLVEVRFVSNPIVTVVDWVYG